MGDGQLGLSQRRLGPAIARAADSFCSPRGGEERRGEEGRGAVVLTDVVFAYPTRPQVLVANGYTLRIDAGSVCALVGRSGGGKSTIVNMLMRFYDPKAVRTPCV